MTWIASAIERRGSRRRRRDARATSTATARPTGCGSSRTTAQAYDWYYNVVANPMLWFMQHSLWEPRVHAGHRPRVLHSAWRDGLRSGQRALRGRGRSRSSTRKPDADGLLPRLPPVPRAAARARGAPGRDGSRTSSTSRGRSRLLARAAEDDAARDPRRAARERRRRLPHRPLAPELHLQRARAARRATSLATDARHRTDLGRPARVRRAARSDAVLERGARARRESPREARSCASTAPIRRRTSCAASARSSCYLDAHPEARRRVGMLALLDPSRQDIPEYAEYLGAIQREARARQRPLPARAAGCRSTCRSRTTSRSRSPRTSSSTCCS